MPNKLCFRLITETFKTEREKYNYPMVTSRGVRPYFKNIGANRSSNVANGVLARVKEGS
jgi:tryptophanyl-tRNA synthetase